MHPALETFAKGPYLILRIYSWEPRTYPIGIEGSDLYQNKNLPQPLPREKSSETGCGSIHYTVL